jgi:hypothetical protein
VGVWRACRSAEEQDAHYASQTTVFDELGRRMASDLLSRGACPLPDGEHTPPPCRVDGVIKFQGWICNLWRAFRVSRWAEGGVCGVVW